MSSESASVAETGRHGVDHQLSPNYITWALTVYSLVALLGIVGLAGGGGDVPESLVATLGMAVGALAQRLNQKH